MPPADGHQYALDQRGGWVNACTIPFSPLTTYYCECPERHRLKHVKPSGKEHKRTFTAYFAHITNGGKRRRDADAILCSGGESLQHRLAKHRLRENVHLLSFATHQCPLCRAENVFECQGCSVRLEIRSADGLWRYDCMLYDPEGAKRFALEVAHTHFTGQAKADATRLTGLGIAEFAVVDVMGLGPGVKKLKNLLVIKRRCEACLRQELEAARVEEIDRETNVLLEWEYVVQRALVKQWKSNAFVKSLALMGSNMEKAIAILDHYQDSSWFETHRWGRICLRNNLNECPYGLGLVVRAEDVRIPAKDAFLMVMDRSWETNPSEINARMKAVWQRYSICRDLVFGLTCENIINRLEEFKAGGKVLLTNQLFAILKKIEMDHQICAQCGTYGHKSDTCQRKFCTKCGRGGHVARDCYAKSRLGCPM